MTTQQMLNGASFKDIQLVYQLSGHAGHASK